MQKTPAFAKMLNDHGSDPLVLGTAEFIKFMDDELAKWGKVVKQAGIKAQ